MAAKFKLSIREFLSGSYYRLIAVSVGLSVLPLICALIAAEIDVYRQKAHFFMTISDEVGSAVQAQQDRLAQSAITVLNGLADNYDTYGAAAQHYRELFSLTRSMYPHLRSVGLYERDGAPVAASGPDGEPARNLRLLADNIPLSGIVSGETIITSARDARELLFIQPLRDNDGVIRRFLTLSVGLDAYVRMIRSLKLPFAYSIAMFNQERALILEDAEPGRQKPRALETGALLPEALTRDGHGADVIAGQDGRYYICTFFSQKINMFSRPYLTTLLIAQREEVLLDAYRAAGASLIWVTVAVLGTALVLTTACSAAFRRPINRLLGISRKLGQGEFSARSELAEVGVAFRDYALALSNMAESLEKDERALKIARLDAESASRSKSEFLANMSHELRTPMNAILGMTYLALKSDVGPAQRDYVHKIQAASRNLLRIINDILDFSKLEAGKMSMEMLRFSIRDIFSSLPVGYRRQIEERGIKMEIEVDAAVPVYLMGDPLRLEQILKQLVDSAMQRAKSGVVRIGCSLVGLAGNDCALRITVADTGKSIAPDTLHMLDSALSASDPGFYPYAERDLEQSLWPSIARKLVSMMNGSISVSSEPGRGTVFTCTAHFGYDKSEQGRDAGALAGKRILLADDDPDALKLHLSLLSGFSMQSKGCAQARQALDELADADAEGAGYDFLVLDWSSVEPDLRETLQHIRSAMRLKKYPLILATSAFGIEEAGRQAEEGGADAFLHKPMHDSLFIDTLLDLCSGRNTSAESPAGVDAGQDKSPAAGFRVLLVEDNPVNQQLAREILEEGGNSVTVADNGSDALAVLDAGQGEQAFDIVIMDLEMPGMDGFEATWRIRKDGHLGAAHLPVIAMTAHSHADEVEAYRKSGMDDYLSKPIDLELLARMLRRWRPITPDTRHTLADPLEKLIALLRDRQEEAGPCCAGILARLRQFVGDGRAEKLRQLILEADWDQALSFAAHLHKKLREGRD